MIAIEIIVGFVAGAVVGWGYFHGLWLTIERVVDSQRPALLVGSFVVRAAVAVLAAAALIAWSLPAFVAAGFAFAIARRVLVARHRRALT